MAAKKSLKTKTVVKKLAPGAYVAHVVKGKKIVYTATRPTMARAVSAAKNGYEK